MKNYLLTSFIVAISMTLLSQPISAAEKKSSIGQVVWVKGSVKASSEGKSRSLQRRSPIFDKDIIVTDKSGSGQIVFSDNSSVSLNPETTFEINEYKFEKKMAPGQVKFIAKLVTGGLRTVTGLIPKQNAENYKVSTPAGTIGVRGTNYALVYKGQLFIKYFKGKPCITNKSGTTCLDEDTKFLSISDWNATPIKLAHDPGVFSDMAELVPANFTSSAVNSNDMMPGGGGGTLDGRGSNSLTPKGNSFCIQ